MRKHKWLLLVLVVAMVMSLALSGCSKDEKSADDTNNQEAKNAGKEELADEQVLRVNFTQEPPDLDPQTTTDQVSMEILNDIYEGLVRLNPDGTVGEGLAKDWDISEDKKAYTFHLRDAKWSDGTPITAYDFEDAWFRAITPEVAAQYSYQFTQTAGIKNAEKYFKGEIKDKSQVGIKAVDDKTFKVELERPVPFFLSLVSSVTFIPPQKAAVEKFGDKFASEPDKMVYSGPFKLTKWDHEQKVVLEKNENYWDAKSVKLDKIIGDMITESNTYINLYETGELDTTGVPSEFLDNYKDSDEFQNLALASTWYIQYNCEDKYLKNFNIRKALSLALDRKSFVDNVLRDGSIVAEGLTPNLLPGKDGKEFAENRGNVLPEYNGEEAKKCFEKGLEELSIDKKEFEKHMTFLIDDTDKAKKEAAAIQNMWKKNLGVEIIIEPVSFKLRVQRYTTKDYTLTFAGWTGDYNDPLTFMDLWVTGAGNNTVYWSNDEYDKCIDKAINGDGDERIDAMLEAENILAEELPIFPIYHQARNFVNKPYVKDVVRFPIGSDLEFKWAYILKH